LTEQDFELLMRALTVWTMEKAFHILLENIRLALETEGLPEKIEEIERQQMINAEEFTRDRIQREEAVILVKAKLIQLKNRPSSQEVSDLLLDVGLEE